MVLKMLKSRKFWIIWLILSFVGMVIGFYVTSQRKERRESTLRCHANLFGKYESIFVVEEHFLDVYVNYFEYPDDFEYLPFRLNAIRFNQEVLVTDTLMDGKILEIDYYDKTLHGNVWRWNSAFIYYKYLEGCYKKPVQEIGHVPNDSFEKNKNLKND